VSDRVTLSSLDQKLDGFMVVVTKQLDRLTEAVDGNGKPGLKTRIELVEARLESHDEGEKGRKTNMRLLWGAVLTALGSIAAKAIAG